MADYNALIDAQTWAFIERTSSFYPPETATFSIADQRRIYNEMCAGFAAERPGGVTARDEPYGGVACRHYTAGGSTAAVVYFHGGGFVVGGLDSHDDVCAEICAQTGCDVVSVDYRLAPEHKHPAAFDDAMSALQAVAGRLRVPLILVGDSAGANLAAASAHMTRGKDVDIIGQMLIYPGLGGDPSKGSYLEHAEAPMLTLAEIMFYKDIRLSGADPVGDPSYAPLHDTDFTDLPPTIVITAQCDPLSDDGRDYEAALTAASVPVYRVDEPGLVHGYLRARHSVDRARTSFERIIAGIAALASKEWPY